MPWDFLLLLIVLAVVVPAFTAREMRAFLPMPVLTAPARHAIYATTMAFQWVATAVVIWRVEARGVQPAELGVALPEPGRAFASAFVLTAGLVAYQLWSLARMARLPPEEQGVEGHLARKLMPQSRRELPLFLALTATVALCEEFLFRGFAYAAIRLVIEHPAAAILGSSVLFSFAHAYQGPRGMFSTFVVGLLFAAAREWTGSLAPVVVAHFAADLIAGLVAPRWLALPAPAAEVLERGEDARE